MSNKRAMITGASEGLGRVFAKRLASADYGYDTVCVARNESRLRELMGELGPGDHRYVVADLATDAGVDRCVEEVQRERVNLLVNNAGFSRFGAFEGGTAEDERRILSVNCDAVMTLAHAFLKQAESGDALINLSSITNFLPTPLQPTYCATKAFIASLSESLWYQQRPRGVYVQGLCPGVAKTKFVERAGELGEKKRLLDAVSQTAESVVDVSLAALDKRTQPIVVPGVGNRIIAGASRLLPRRPLIWLSGKLGDLAGLD
jgi:hypothetical protein